MKVRAHTGHHARSSSGQTFLLIAVFFAVFLAGVIGLSTDYAQVWARRQMAQGAADAACQAGAADIYLKYIEPTAPGTLSYSWIGSANNCSVGDTTSPCVYASKNGYTGSGNTVAVTFPSAASETFLPSLSGYGTITNPYIKVVVTDPVAMSFARLISSGSTFNISATAYCGLAAITVPIPLIILHSTASGSLSTSGGGGNSNTSIQIYGGPTRAIQVDSSSATAVSVGGNSTIDLTCAGPGSTGAGCPSGTGNGADFGVFGSETQPSGVSLGNGTWRSPALGYGDPFVTIPTPSAPGSAGKAYSVPFAYNGCPDPTGCVEFSAGNYASCTTSASLSGGDNGCLVLPYSGGSVNKFNNNSMYSSWTQNHPYAVGDLIQVSGSGSTRYMFKVTTAGTSGSNPGPTFNTTWLATTTGDGSNGLVWTNEGIIQDSPKTAIFDPGLYYVGANGLNLGSGATARMSSASGDGSEGVTLYFSTSATLSVGSNSGGKSSCTNASTTSGNAVPNNCIVSYVVDGTAATVGGGGSVPMRKLQCAATGSPSNPSTVPSTLDGNILLGPCSGTYGDAASQNRGFLFFQNRSVSASPSWSGGGSFLLSGIMYFHSSTTGTTCGTTTTCMTLGGNSGSNAYTLGNIVVDQLSISGGPSLKMYLNPNSSYSILRPQLIR